MSTDAVEKILLSLHNEITTLAEEHPNAVSRRIVSLIGKKINTVRGESDFEECPNLGNLRIVNERTRDSERFNARDRTFIRTYYEDRADQKRKSIFVDPVENVAQNYLKLLSGDIAKLEISVQAKDDEIVIQKGRELAQRLYDEIILAEPINVPSKTNLLSKADQLIAAANSLKRIAYGEEPGELKETIKDENSPSGLREVICSKIRTRYDPPVWDTYGRKMTRVVTETYSCTSGHAFDECCENFREWEEERQRIETWIETNDPNNPPPDGLIPPSVEDFGDWDNRCPVFSGPMGKITSDFGWRDSSGKNEPPKLDFHPGMDIGVPVGTPVFSTVNGTVTHQRPDAGDGRAGVHIRSGDTVYVFWHVDSQLSKNDPVTVGQQIGVTGQYKNPHLHYARYQTDSNGPSFPNTTAITPCP